MCFEPSARPPLPPIAGGADVSGTQSLELEASDGNRFSAFGATHAYLGGPGMVILPDVRGLHPFYEDLAVRFAEAGVHACAIDYFGRTAGTGKRDDDFDFMSHVQQTRPGSIADDVAAAVAHLRSEAGGGAEAVYTVGFCFGGRASFNQAVQDHGLAGVIGFYGVVQQRGPDDADAPILRVGNYRCPVLGLFGGADRAVPREEVGRFGRALDEAGVKNDIVVYDGAPHSFFDRSFDEHRDACEDAWRRMLAFVGRAPD